MKIMQYNTHHGGIGSDSILNTPRIAESIKLHVPDVDVVCLNEVEQFTGYGSHDCVQIWCDILGASWAGVFANTSGTLWGHGQCNVILSRLPMTGNFTKGLKYGRVAVGTIINGITIISAHLANDSANERCVQTFQVIKESDRQSTGKVALCGDWNSHDGNVEQAPLQAFFSDAWKHAAGKSAFNTSGITRGSRIDAIFTQGLSVSWCDVPDMRVGGIFPSDHHPVVVTIP